MASKTLLVVAALGFSLASFVAYSSNESERPVPSEPVESSATAAALKRMSDETPLPPSEAQGNRYCVSGPLGGGHCTIK